MSVRALLFTAASLCLVPSGCKDAAFGPEDATAIRSVMDAQQAAWNAGDIDAFMQGYHQQSDVVFTSGGKIRKGWQATLTAYRERYVEGDAKMGALAFSDLEIQELGPGAAVVLGRWELSETPQAGHGVFSLVFTKAQGQWAILHDHSSSE
ncbi:MAG: YybH family protein [Nannocystales bacterium]